jgi:glycosyltransferase involved in cell wall biosynthesis
VRILVVNWLDRSNPQAGGAEMHLHEIFGRLAGWGHEVTLLCSGFPGAPERERMDGMEVHRIGGRMTFGLHVPRYVMGSPELQGVHVVVEDLNKVPLFMPFWCRAPVVLLVHHLFGGTAFQEASFPVALATWLLERPVPLVFRKAPVMTVSESTAQDLRRRGMVWEEGVVVHNGVDPALFSPDPGQGEFQEPTLLYLGRLKRYKRVDLLLEAVARLRREGTEVRLLVAGQGDYESELLRLRQRLGLGNSVEFLGYVSETEKVRLLRRSWVHLLTSPKEGWGISVMEAAACGTPTVASDSPGLRDSVQDGKTGLLVPHGDVEALAKAIRALMEDASLRNDMGSAARRFAEGFTWEASARTTEGFLSRQVAATRAHP